MIAPCCGTKRKSALSYVIANNWQLKSNKKNIASYFRCPNCASLLMQPFPTLDELSDHFCVAYYRDIELEGAIADDKAPKYSFVLHELGKLCPNLGNLLDIGCAHGYGLDVAKQYGWTPFGIEIDSDVFHYVESRGYHVAKGTSVSDWNDGILLDAILYMDVLYYFDDPYLELLKARDKLVPGGWLVVRVSLWARLVSALRRLSGMLFDNEFIRQRAAYFLCDHIIEFSERGFEQLLISTGYEIHVKEVDWGDGWRGGDSLFAVISRKTSALIAKYFGIRITPSMYYIVRKI